MKKEITKQTGSELEELRQFKQRVETLHRKFLRSHIKGGPNAHSPAADEAQILDNIISGKPELYLTRMAEVLHDTVEAYRQEAKRNPEHKPELEKYEEQFKNLSMD